ncbi:hypothetical protein G8759_23740 [Spirosoma aureum]|uniref:Uncharacterized protein n=1 Tax=Spirosoma aureum TaxID=2692134 RepID=A0A6G9ASR4_9BACT|nr:hypothetical protein [Spirosoma aureum]QIP15428.1 hypothetical protein G8759_23740 [Spirosoma aureum]
MRRSRLLLFIALWVGIFGQKSWSQSVPIQTTQPVKQIEEFLKRFYYDQTPDQRPLTTDSLRALYPRRAYLLSLFDAKDSRRTTQPSYKQAIDTFVTELSEAEEKPDDLYANVLVETPFRASYRGKTETLTVFWQMTHIGRAQGWRMVGLAAPFLTASTDTSKAPLSGDTTQRASRPLTLSPNTHETSFLEFHQVIKQGHDLRLLLSDSLGQTGVGQAFIEAVRQRELRLIETERVSLFILTQSGWIVRVDEFPRDNENAGWLISDLFGNRSPSRLPPELATLVRIRP